MSHARQQIREAIASLLATLSNVDAENVFTSRPYPVNSEALPAIVIFCEMDEIIDVLAAMGEARGYLLRVVVDVIVRPTSGADDLLDSICAEAQAALLADDTLGGLVKDLELQTTEIVFEDESENATGSAKMTFACLYRINRTDPETLIA